MNGSAALVPLTITRTLDELRNDVVSTARKWASEEVSVAIAHQLNEPLSALLLYLREIKQQQGAEAMTPEASLRSAQALTESALKEAQRLCDFVEHLGRPPHGSTATERCRNAIYSSANDARPHAALPAPQNGIQNLTPREREVLSTITGGASNKEGGRHLGISTRTFEVHRANIMEKLGARNAADLVRIALS